MLAVLAFAACSTNALAQNRVDQLAAGGAIAATDLFAVCQGCNASTALLSATGAQLKIFMSASPTLVTPALGTPVSGVLTNATGLPISTGISGLGTGVATFLGTPTGANLTTALSSGGGTTNFLRADGAFATPPGGGAVGANPTASAGTAAVNGSAATFMRSDAAPAVPAMTATVAGLVPTPPNDATKFLNGQGAFTAPSGSGSGGGMFGYSDNGLTLTAGTRYVPIYGSGTPSTTEADYSTKSPSATTAANLQVNLSADPGAGQTLVVTLRKAGADTTLTCTVTGGSGVVCQDLTHSVSVAQNDLIDWKVVTTGTFVSTPSLTILANNGTSNVGVTSVATTAPITGGTITTTGTIACATCVTSAASLTSGAVMTGAGSQASQVDASITASAGALSLGSSGTAGSVALGNATSGTITLQPVTGALGSVTASLPANTGTIAELNLNQAWTAGQAVTPDTATQCGTQSAAGTMTPNFALSNSCVATFGAGNLTIANPTGAKAGQNWVLSLTQDGTGSRTVTWGANYKFPGGNKPALSSAAGAVDIISCWATTSSLINCALMVPNAS